MRLIDFLRVAKSDIIFIVGLSAFAGFLANPAFVNRPLTIVPLLASALIASGSAAIFNNLYDSDLDRNMKRTQYRGEIIDSSRKPLTVIASVMLASSVILAYAMINLISSVFIFLGFLTYTVVYTMLLKRRTYWSIVIGGIAASFALLAGWTSSSSSITVMGLYLAILLFAWIPLHFWSFAASHNEDYSNAGIPMLPAVVGMDISAKILVALSLILAAVAGVSVFVVSGSISPVYIIFIAVLSAILLALNVLTAIGEKTEIKFRRIYAFSHVYIIAILAEAIFMNFPLFN